MRVSECVCFVLALLDEQHLYIMAFVLRLSDGRKWVGVGAAYVSLHSQRGQGVEAAPSIGMTRLGSELQ